MEASTTEEQAKLKIAHLTQELNEKEPQAVMAEKENHGLLGQVDEKRKIVSQLEVNRQYNDQHWMFLFMYNYNSTNWKAYIGIQSVKMTWYLSETRSVVSLQTLQR